MDEKDRAFICIRGPLINILVSIAPDVYGPYATVGKKGEKQLLVQYLTALYGTMVVLLLYYKKCVKSLQSKGFKLNPYDPCVANKQVKREQLTVCFHVDDCKILHLIPKVVDETIECFDLNMSMCLKMELEKCMFVVARPTSIWVCH